MEGGVVVEEAEEGPEEVVEEGEGEGEAEVDSPSTTTRPEVTSHRTSAATRLTG